ncbi:MAG: hypothetical protein HC907_36680 [Richelia sp. SM1_7_0]|nr:hypothetical protein [Richelia sp. SM1_7_0]
MAEIINFYNKQKQRLWAVWKDERGYQAVDISGKSKTQIFAILPNPTPNFIYQVGIERVEVIELVKMQQVDALLN